MNNQKYTQRFKAECRNCPRTVSQEISREPSEGPMNGAHIACVGCGTANWCKPTDNE